MRSPVPSRTETVGLDVTPTERIQQGVAHSAVFGRATAAIFNIGAPVWDKLCAGRTQHRTYICLHAVQNISALAISRISSPASSIVVVQHMLYFCSETNDAW
jgi:hypothetical protein